MDSAFVAGTLAALTSAVVALWVRIKAMQDKVEALTRDEAACQAKLDMIQRSLEAKHQENQAAIASLYCQREQQ